MNHDAIKTDPTKTIYVFSGPSGDWLLTLQDDAEAIAIAESDHACYCVKTRSGRIVWKEDF